VDALILSATPRKDWSQMFANSRKAIPATLMVVIVTALGTVQVGFAQPAIEAVPGRSVVGLGLLPERPDLFIHDSGGNDVVEIVVGESPAAYGANIPSPNYPNACLLDDGAGIADVGAPGQGATSKNHAYTFTFAAGVSVGRFSIVLLDWGDFLPFGENPDHRSEVTVRGYDAVGEVVDSETLGFTTSNAAKNGRITPEFGNLTVSGDACTARWGEPGRHEFVVTGPGIVRVELRFRDRASMDPNVALDRIQYWINDGVGTQGYWKNHDWPVDEMTLGGVTYTREAALMIMDSPVRGDMTYALFEQLAAAKLNVAAGNEASCIEDVIAAADAWLAAHPLGSDVKAKSSAWKTEGSALHATLDQYNNGLLCAAHRG
jgi:hypothetical protein